MRSLNSRLLRLLTRSISGLPTGGWLKAREAGTNLPFQKCGLVSTIQHTVETNDITLADTTTPQGGEYDSVSRVTSVGLSVNFRELYTWVLGALVWGDTTSVPSTTITDETHLAGVDGTIALAQMPLTIASVAAGTGSTTFKEDDDWVMTGSGIEPVPGGALEPFEQVPGQPDTRTALAAYAESALRQMRTVRYHRALRAMERVLPEDITRANAICAEISEACTSSLRDFLEREMRAGTPDGRGSGRGRR